MGADATPPTRAYGLVPREEVLTMSGLELLRGMIEGRFPAAPVSQAAGFRLVDAGEGMVVFEGEPSAAFMNPLGTVHGGWAATLLDSVMGCAVHSTLKAGQFFTTAEFKIHLVRAIMPDTGTVRAEGRVIHPGSRMATSEGRILDSAGKLLAHGTETCFVFSAAGKG